MKTLDSPFQVNASVPELRKWLNDYNSNHRDQGGFTQNEFATVTFDFDFVSDNRTQVNCYYDTSSPSASHLERRMLAMLDDLKRSYPGVRYSISNQQSKTGSPMIERSLTSRPTQEIGHETGVVMTEQGNRCEEQWHLCERFVALLRTDIENFADWLIEETKMLVDTPFEYVPRSPKDGPGYVLRLLPAKEVRLAVTEALDRTTTDKEALLNILRDPAIRIPYTLQKPVLEFYMYGTSTADTNGWDAAIFIKVRQLDTTGEKRRLKVGVFYRDPILADCAGKIAMLIKSTYPPDVQPSSGMEPRTHPTVSNTLPESKPRLPLSYDDYPESWQTCPEIAEDYEYVSEWLKSRLASVVADCNWQQSESINRAHRQSKIYKGEVFTYRLDVEQLSKYCMRFDIVQTPDLWANEVHGQAIREAHLEAADLPIGFDTVYKEHLRETGREWLIRMLQGTLLATYEVEGLGTKRTMLTSVLYDEHGTLGDHQFSEHEYEKGAFSEILEAIEKRWKTTYSTTAPLDILPTALPVAATLEAAVTQTNKVAANWEKDLQSLGETVQSKPYATTDLRYPFDHAQKAQLYRLWKTAKSLGCSLTKFLWEVEESTGENISGSTLRGWRDL